ncbi:MAG: LD-carboxypeptidase [Chitinophagaceae bacterium]|nr:LD-carboxypeptidase [Chitinophagaceae bacterium]MCW5925970.1 LD-carboxypeptidase [Chitinophagaceae bacterium]
MKRKQFLSSIVSAGFIPATIQNAGTGEFQQVLVVPPALNRGDTIGITSPAGFITPDDLQPAIRQLEAWGFKVRLGNTIGKRDFSFGGSDEERSRDFQLLLDDAAVKAILCARGGYGTVRIIDKINFSRLAGKPKWIIGFSDITVLHCHINANFRVATVHSKMCNSFPGDPAGADRLQTETIASIKDAITGVKMKYTAPLNERNRTGVSEATLIGGNLKTIENLSGTKSEIKTAGKILFLEDAGEYLYSVDRMFWNLKRTGKLAQLKGLIIGGFRIKPDEPGEEFGRTLYEIVEEAVKEYDYPVCFDFPVGHQKNNYAIKCGTLHRLSVTKNKVELAEV